MATNEEVLAAIGRVDAKVDGIADQVSGLGDRMAQVEAWKDATESTSQRHLDKTDEIEVRLRGVETLSAITERVDSHDTRLNSHSERVRSLELSRAKLLGLAAAAGAGSAGLIEGISYLLGG